MHATCSTLIRCSRKIGPSCLPGCCQRAGRCGTTPPASAAARRPAPSAASRPPTPRAGRCLPVPASLVCCTRSSSARPACKGTHADLSMRATRDLCRASHVGENAYERHMVAKSSLCAGSTPGSDTLQRWNCLRRRAMRSAMAGSVSSTGVSVRMSRKDSRRPLSKVARSCMGRENSVATLPILSNMVCRCAQSMACQTPLHVAQAWC